MSDSCSDIEQFNFEEDCLAKKSTNFTKVLSVLSVCKVINPLDSFKLPLPPKIIGNILKKN